MAQFNVDVGGIPSPNMPDQTGASRGIDTNRSFEYLFKGVGDAIGGVATAIDSDIKKTIENETMGIYDTVNKPYADTIPSELASSGAALKSLQTAFDQGKISDTYYYGQLTNLTKKMRSKYPGYEAYVDDTIQAVTGVKPANAYRNALLQEFADEANKASSEEKFRQQWEKENQEWIRLAGYADYFSNPGKYDFTKVRQDVVDLQATDQYYKSEDLKAVYLDKQKQLSDETATEIGINKLNYIVQSYMQGLGNSVGLGGNDLMKKIEEAQAGGYTPEELTAITNEINSREAELRVALSRIWSTPLDPSDPGSSSYDAILPGKGKELIEQAMSPFLAIKQMVKDGDVGLAGFYTRINTLTKDKELNRILNKSDDLKTFTALVSIDRDLGLQWLHDSLKQVGIFKDIAPEISGRIAEGKDTFNEATQRVIDATGSKEDKSGFINTTLDNLTAAITTGGATPEQVHNTVASLYALDAEGKDIWSYVQPNEYMSLYNRMFNPTITQGIVANGSKEDLQNYFKAAYQRVTAIPELRKAAANFGESNAFWKEDFEIQLDPKSNRFILNVKRPNTYLNSLDIGSSLGYSLNIRTAESGINALNNGLDTIGQIADAMGVSPEEKAKIAQTLIKELNVNLDQGRDGFFNWINQFVTDLTTTSETDYKAGQSIVDNIDFTLPISDTVGNDSFDLPSENPEVAKDLSQYLVKGQPTSYINDLSGDFATKISELINSAPEEVRSQLQILSGARSIKRQQELWDEALKKYGSARAARKWVAPPGKSHHNIGEAIDWRYLSDEAKQWVHGNADRFGLWFPLNNEPYHMEPKGSRG